MSRAELINLSETNYSTVSVRADRAFKIWLYRNDAAPGFVVDGSLTDRCLAIKGGTDSYNVSGGNTDSDNTWTISGLTKDQHAHAVGSRVVTMDVHTHRWYNFNSSSADTSWQSNGSSEVSVQGSDAGQQGIATNAATNLDEDFFTENVTSTGTISGNSGNQTDAGITSSANWRPAAVVGTLQKPEI